MKSVLKTLLTLFIIFSGIQITYAEELEDMSKWSFKILLQHADQSDKLKVVRFKNKETDRFGFCLEPEVDYAPLEYSYEKSLFDDDRVFNIYRAFENLGEDYYIAAQLMIWEYKTGVRYSFDGKDASDFGEEKILDKIKEFSEQSETKEITVFAEKGETSVINVENLKDYDIVQSDVDILEMTETEIRYQYTGGGEDSKIILESHQSLMSGSFIYHSNESQDIYSYEGDYGQEKKIIIHVKQKNDIDGTFSYSFRKTDSKGNPLPGALFRIYEIAEEGDEFLLIKKGAKIEFSVLFDGLQSIELSERYEKYMDGTSFFINEIGFFPYTVTSDSKKHKGIAFVCDDDHLSDASVKIIYGIKIDELFSSDKEINTIENLDSTKQYILCEIEPRKGYTFASDPCVMVNSMTATEKAAEFVNRKRRFDLKLYKENEERNILLNGAKFMVSYIDKGDRKEHVFVTGALNIHKDKEGSYIMYRHENEENIHISMFEGNEFIKENIRPGKYYYCITDETNINNSSLLNRETEVSEGSFTIFDIPYFSQIDITELEAPKGYFIEEASYSINADLDYSQIVFRNFRMNRSEIIPGKKHKFPKTCVGN